MVAVSLSPGDAPVLSGPPGSSERRQLVAGEFMRNGSAMARSAVLVLGIAGPALVGCGTFTGFPTHGGGKRFCVEQELIAASARAVAKALDVKPVVGRKCALYVVTMGDEGSGNMVGGRYTWEAAIRGEYINTAPERTSNVYPVVPARSRTTAGGGETTTTEVPLNAPSRTRTRTRGTEQRYGGGVSYQGPGSYATEAYINPRDTEFLRAVIHEALALRGVLIVPPAGADVDLYVTVDVFGTRRSRTEMHVYNRESLLAKTALQMTGFDRNRRVVLPPTTASFEAEYTEDYVLWIGPFRHNKCVRRSEDLLVDFRGIIPTDRPSTAEPVGVVAPAASPTIPKTRTRDLTTPRTAPQTFRPEDVEKRLKRQPQGP